jgi:uncharacterized membrane protein
MMRVLILCVALAACSGEPAGQSAETETPAVETPTESPRTPAETAAAPATSNEANLAQMPSWQEARTRGVDFRAVGQEPGWLLDIYTRDRIRFLWDYGESLADFPLTSPNTAQEGVTRYQTQADGRTLTITIRRTPCNDGMSGEAYPARVDVEIDGRALNGCGRSV